MNRKVFIFGLIAATCLLVAILPVKAQGNLQVAGEWSEPEPISPESEWSWFPTMTFDPYGQLHVIWCWTRPNPNTSGLIEQIKYIRLNGARWEKLNDIIPPSADIERNAIAADQIGNLHLVFGGSAYGNLEIYYQSAPSQDGWSARAWTAPLRLNQGGSYYSEIEVDSQGNLYVLFDDTIYEQNTDPQNIVVSDIYFRKSSDGGNNWTWPLVLQYHPESGSARPTLLVDQQDVIHVTWDEGWDRLTGQRSEDFYSVYMFSTDGGTTWSDPTEIYYPDRRVAQMTVGSDNQGGVMLVWRSMERANLYYQWSTNQGRTWTRPATIPDIYARPYSFPHDQYTMITDSAGNIHLLVSGRLTTDSGAAIGIYHLTWDGENWSQARQVFLQDGLLAFYPSAAIRNGNELHAAWFTMEQSEWQDDVNRVVWHSWIQLLTPREIVTPWPTPSPTPTRVVLSPTPESTKTPLPDFVSGAEQKDGGLIQPNPYSETDELAILGIALLPVVLVIFIIFAIRWVSAKN